MKKLLCSLAGVACLGAGVASANTLDQIKSSKVLRIGVSEHMAPFSVLQSDGSFEGFEIDFAKEIAKAILGDEGRIEFVGVPQKERLDYVKDNKVDLLIAAYTRNEKRAQVADFSVPYFSINLSTVSKRSAGIKSIEDLEGKRIAVIGESNSDVWVRKNPNITPVPCQNNKDCYDKVNRGEADAYMHNIVSVASVPVLDLNFEVSIPKIGETFFDCVVTQKGNRDMLQLVDQKIFELSQAGYFDKKYDETIGPFYNGNVPKHYFLLDDLYSQFLNM